MTDDAFLRAIIENPDDDAPRLIYADWLDEQGQSERAEFIRVQCQLARMAEEDPRRQALEERAEELFAEHKDEWTAELPDFVERCEFRRGFLTRVIAPAAKFLKHPHALDHLPFVSDAWFWGVTPRLAPTLLDLPFLARLTSLDLSGNQYGDTRAQAVAASPRVANLTALRLVRTRLTDSGVEALAASPHLSRLSVLDLGENRIGDRGLRALAESPYLRQLRSLSLAANGRLGVPGVQAIAGSLQVTSFNLSYNFLRDEGTEVLVASAHMSSLAKLNLSSCRIGNRGARALAASRHLLGLKRLNLDLNRIGVTGARALASSPYLSQLTWLGMRLNPLEDAGVEALRLRFGDRVSV
jgi:uncharacterized protein (TIGR02996 family)